jgi:[ribosomal protein S18]-alanine N-acetyltransferase
VPPDRIRNRWWRPGATQIEPLAKKAFVLPFANKEFVFDFLFDNWAGIMAIRTMNIDDYDAIQKISDQSHIVMSHHFFSKLLQDNHGLNLVAEQNGHEVIGFITSQHIDQELSIFDVAVHPEFRQQGIGLALCNELLHRAEALKICSFNLEVRATNSAAYALYKKCGFTDAYVRKKYYQDNNEDAIVMIRKL